MKEWLMPIVGTVVATIIIALAQLFGSVQHNSDSIETTNVQVERNRHYLIKNHDDVIRLQEFNRHTKDVK